jgi:hypothetical protein
MEKTPTETLVFPTVQAFFKKSFNGFKRIIRCFGSYLLDATLP